jgi:type III restriction enzyme
VAVVTASIADNSIEIPEIVVLPSREVNFWFEDFDLSSISDIRFQPISDRLLVRNLRDQTQRELARTGWTAGGPDRKLHRALPHGLPRSRLR